MGSRVRRFFDIRPGEGLPVLLAFLYVALVVASFLLAKPIRNGLFLREFGAYSLVYVYAAVPLVLSVFVPVYNRFTARFGARSVTIGTLLFFTLNVLGFWYAFTWHPFDRLAGIFYVWVNCFGIIAGVQAWSFANSLFDTRQAKRLFGLIGSGASFGAIAGGVMARFLTEPVGGAVNMMLVLALLIFSAAAVVTVARIAIRRPGLPRRSRPAARPFRDTWTEIAASPYLRLLAALVFLVAIATQWTGFQLNLVARRQFGGNADDITRFFGTFNFVLGSISFLVQLFFSSRALQKFGLGVTILIFPLTLGVGYALVLLAPGFWSVLLTNSAEQGLRFSVDKASYELLYLPIPPAQRAHVKNAIDIVVNRVADGVGAVLLGVATQGFFTLPGLELELRGTAAINLCFIGAWVAIAWRLRGGYIRTIKESIHQHRIDTERSSAAMLDKSAAEVLRDKLTARDALEVKYALALIEAQNVRSWHPLLRDLLVHPDPEIRRRALALLAASRDREIMDQVAALLRDPDLGVRTEALLYLSREAGIDPLRRIEQLGDFEDFSIRATTAAFLASPGPAQNLEAARVIIEAMTRNRGPSGRRDRIEAARLVATVPEAFLDLLPPLVGDEDLEVARHAIRAARAIARDELVPPLIKALDRAELADEAAGALARLGDTVVPRVAEALADESVSMDVRRELPSVLLRIGTAAAEQVLVQNMLDADSTVRHRIVASLNKLRVLHPDVHIDESVIELLLAAEIAGHYRSYQVLGPLQAQLKADDPVLDAVRHSMEQELERIFRLMALLLPETGLHDAYIGVRSANPTIRANALEFLDNVLKPQLRQVLVPLLDSHVTVAERIALADRLVGAPLATAEQAVATLLASEDPWLRSSAIYAVGALQLRGLEPALRRLETTPDPMVAESIRTARARLAGELPGAEPQEPPPADLGMGVGAG